MTSSQRQRVHTRRGPWMQFRMVRGNNFGGNDATTSAGVWICVDGDGNGAGTGCACSGTGDGTAGWTDERGISVAFQSTRTIAVVAEWSSRRSGIQRRG